MPKSAGSIFPRICLRETLWETPIVGGKSHGFEHSRIRK